jgi:hypothetical protein
LQQQIRGIRRFKTQQRFFASLRPLETRVVALYPKILIKLPNASQKK